MTMAQVTDEMVEKAARAMYVADCGQTSWEEAPDWMKEGMRNCARAALESVADDLRREGMMEDAKYLDDCEKRLWASGQAAPAAALSVARHNILARANQLSPAKQKETA